MTRVGKAAVVLVLSAGLVLLVLVVIRVRNATGDPLDVLAIPFLIFYTMLAVGGVVFFDFLYRFTRARRARRDIANPS